jgi:hypothetical protein
LRKHFAWLIPITYIFLLLILGSYGILSNSNNNLTKITEIGLTWPVITIIFLCSIIYLFEEPIRNFITRMKVIQGDKWAITTQQDNNITEDSVPISHLHETIIQRDTEWQQAFDEVAASAQKAEEEKYEYQTLMNDLDFEKTKWQFRFADKHLIYKTKVILKLISSVHSFTLVTFAQSWGAIVPIELERKAMIDALLHMEFINNNEGVYAITKTGQLYSDYLDKTSQFVPFDLLIAANSPSE